MLSCLSRYDDDDDHEEDDDDEEDNVDDDDEEDARGTEAWWQVLTASQYPGSELLQAAAAG